MTAAQAWNACRHCCRREHMKRQGRCVATPIRQPDEDAEEEVELGEDETEEPPEGGQVLASVSDDAPVFGARAWTMLCSSSSKHVKGQVLGLRSNLWPGAIALAHGKEFDNVYVGWGIKNAPYVPPPPVPVSTEFDQAQVASVDMPAKPDPDAAPPPGDDAEDD
jgi:radial spoke head protein 4/6